MTLKRYIESFTSGADLNEAAAEPLLDAILASLDEVELRQLFIAWEQKGIAADDIFHVARLLKDRCTRVTSQYEILVDIVGTGGSSSKTFNVSTAAAFVVAGAGIRVAKHGNRAATSNTGSADVLSALGIEHAVNVGTAEKCLNEIGICFMFAPNHHRLSPTLAKVRRNLGFPTVFNCVGPLCNPAGAQFQLIGVWDPAIQSRMATAVARLGTARTWLVHGDPGLDEVSLTGTTKVTTVAAGEIDTLTIGPEDFGMHSSNVLDCRADSPEASAKLILSVLDRAASSTPARSLVEVNAAAAIFLSGAADTLSKAREIAEESIASGSASAKLDALREACK